MGSQARWVAASNTEFVEKLCQENHIIDQRVKQAFLKVRAEYPHTALTVNDIGTDAELLKVDRRRYAPRNAYLHSQEPIGFWAVVNLPYLDALALETTLEYLSPNETYPRRKVLDVGSGSGYTTHLLAEMVGDQGLVIGIDHFHELRDLGERNMGASDRGRELLARGNVMFVSGDGRDGLSIDQRSDIAGVDDNTKWDVIHVGASARWTVPQELMRQLKAPGWWVEPFCLLTAPEIR